MPIVASRGGEIRRLLSDLSDPKRRTGAFLRLRSVGARVVPHVADELGRLDADARRALLDALKDVQTEDARALRKRLLRADAPPPADAAASSMESTRRPAGSAGPESLALQSLRTLAPPRRDERAAVSRERGEAHLALARAGSRLARKELLLSLTTLGADRARLCCEAAGLIGDADFLAPLARLASQRPEAAKAIAAIAAREKITARSKVLRTLDEPLRVIVARALAGL
ncbi:MAG: hypothetical protein K1Y01_07590 [Vicinamibacteria bacterium]|nr:hypothetical protein [Vicinamibacteria bacterium]